MYTLGSLKSLNTLYDSAHRLEQDDVELVNAYVNLIENTRENKPRPGDNIEYTDEYGHYSKNTHILAAENGTGQLSIRICPHVPFIYREGNDQEVGFHRTGGGLLTTVDADSLAYNGKREKMFAVVGHCFHPAHSAIYFNAMVNDWTYVAPDQKHPGYSTKDWAKQYITFIENPHDSNDYRYYGQGVAFRTEAEYKRWKATYKAVGFPGAHSNQTILFHYREQDKLVSLEEWDALDLPMDTRRVNGIIHVKVDYDDSSHMITVYRFTNSGYLDGRSFGPYERAKGTILVAPDAGGKGVVHI